MLPPPARGVASFNATNFTVLNGVVNTVQDLAASGTPNFSSLTLGAALAINSGGTGTTLAPTSGQLLVGNESGGYSLKTINAGTGISVTNNSSSIGFTNTGVTSLAGTDNQVVVSAATGAITLSLPQNISTNSTASFSSLTLTNPLLPASGGTGISTYAAGDLLYYAFGTTLTTLAKGANGQVLSLANGLPVWSSSAPAASHDLLSAQHGDTEKDASPVSRGALITGQGASPLWNTLSLGAAGYFLKSSGTDAVWAPDNNTTYTAGTLLTLSGTIFSVKASTLTNGKLCTFDTTVGLVCDTDSATVGHLPLTIATANGLSLSTQTLSLALASGAVTGALSSTDWNTFNAKQNALSGNGFVKISEAGVISYDNSTYVTGTPWTAMGYITSSGEAGNLVGLTATIANLNSVTGTLGTAAFTDSSAYLAAGATAVNAALLETHSAAYFQIAGTYSTDIHANITALNGVSGSNTGDETNASILSKLALTNISGSNTGDETDSTIKTKLGITTLSGSNTGDQTLSGLGGVPTSRSITINGTSYDLSSDPTWNISSVGEAGNLTGLTATIANLNSVTGTLGTAAFTDSSAYQIAGSYASSLGVDDNYVTDAQVILLGNTSGTNSGDNAVNSLYSGLASAKQAALSGIGFVKISGTNISYDNATYLTANQTLTLSGDISGTGTTTITTTIGNNKVNGAMLALGSDTRGDVMFYNGTDWARLPVGTSGQFLKTQGSGADPLWATDNNTTYDASGTLLNLASTTFSLKEGTLTSGKLCTFDTALGLVCTTDSASVGHAPLTFAGTLDYLTLSGQEITLDNINLTTDVTGNLPTGNGGTGLSTTPTSGEILIGNGTGFTLTTITPSTGISINTATAGHITLSNTGVTSLIATTNQVNVAAVGGVVTLSLPQDIATTSSPEFLNLKASTLTLTNALTPANGGTGLSSISQNSILYASSANVLSSLTPSANQLLITNASSVPNFTNISADNFIQYALLGGRSGGQTLNGSTGATENLILNSTSNATKGFVILNSGGGNVGIGTTSPGSKLQVAGVIQSGVDGTTLGQVKVWSTTGNAEGNIIGLAAGGMRLNTNSYTYPIQIDASSIQLNANGSTGNVGIGQVAPGAKLSVSGGGAFGSSYSATAVADGNLIVSGNVGIGTTGPGYKLDVITTASNDGMRIQYNASDMFLMYLTTGSGIFRNQGWAGGWNITTATDGKNLYVNRDGINSDTYVGLSGKELIVKANGNVGIGTASPYKELAVSLAKTDSATVVDEVADYVGAAILQSSVSSNNGDRIPLVFSLGGAAPHISSVIEAGRESSGWNTYLSFYTNNVTSGPQGVDAIQEKMRITSAGNVGIGQVAPGAKLSVSGGGAFGSSYSATAVADGNLIVSGNVGIGTTNTLVKLHILTDGAAQGALILEDSRVFSSSPSTAVQFRGLYDASNPATFSTVMGGKENAISGDYGGYVALSTKVNGGVLTDRLHITSTGYVGIGTTNPANTLVLGNSALSVAWASQYKVLDMYGYGAMYGSSNGTGFSGTGYGQTGWNNNTYYDGASKAVGTGAASFLMQGTGYLTFSNAPSVSAGAVQTFTERFRIDNSGNVGIGTTSPGTLLSLGSTVEANQFTTKLTLYDTGPKYGFGITGSQLNYISNGAHVFSNSGTSAEQMRITSNGNVGIGTTNPGSKLTIVTPDTNYLTSWGNDGGANNEYLSLYQTADDFIFTSNKNGSGVRKGIGITATGADNTIPSGIYLKTDGNVGIGTTAPGVKLEVIDPNATESRIELGNAAAYTGKKIFLALRPTDNYAQLQAYNYGGPVGMNLSINPSGGNVGIGTTAPTIGKLQVSGGSSFTALPPYGTAAIGNINSTTGWSGSGFLFTNATAGSKAFSMVYNNDTAYFGGIDASTQTAWATLTSSGFGIGTTSPGYKLTVAGMAWVTSGAWSGSDQRWKKNIQPIANSLDKVLQLSGVSYDWRADEFPANNFDNKTHLGFIAQDVEKIAPDLVTTGADGFKGLDYNGFSSLLVGAVQELALSANKQQTQIAGLTENQIKIAQQITGQLADQQLSTQEKITIIGTNLDNLNAEQFDQQIKTIKEQVQSNGNDLVNLKSEQELIQQQYSAISELISVSAGVFDLKNATLKVAGINAGTIAADSAIFKGEIVAGVLVIKAIDQETKTVGQATICQLGTSFDEATKQCSPCPAEQVCAGKSVIIKTKAVNENSRIFLTPVDDLQGGNAYSSNIIAGQSFTVKISAPIDKDVVLNWWIVEEK